MNTWLPIKDEYIVENFDSLLSFLAEADYNNTDDTFLSETIEKLEGVATSLLKENFSHGLGISDTIDTSFIKNLKIVSASLFASYRCGKDIRKLAVELLDTLIVNQIIDDRTSFDRVRNILVKFANNITVRALPYNLKDLMAEDFNPRMFATKLLNIQFEEEKLGTLVFETKGQCVFRNNDIEIIPKTTSTLKNTKLRPLEEVGFNVNIFSDDKKRLSELGFVDQVEMLRLLLKTLAHNVPDSAPKLKEYSNEDVFFVEVVEIDTMRNKILCRSLNPSYEPIELELKFPYYHVFNPYINVSNSKFIEHLEVGQKLKVGFFERENKKYFSFIGQLDEYYFDIDGLDIQQAIFVKDYAKGSTWLTDLGKLVNIMSDPNDYQIEDAESTESPYGIDIRCNYVKNDKSGKTIINAGRTGELFECDDRDKFINDAVDNLVKDLYEYWDLQCPAYIDSFFDKPQSLPSYYVLCLSHILAMRGEDMGLPYFERYMTTVAATALGILLDNKHDIDFCQYNLQFLRALWAFAEGTGDKWLTNTVPAGLEYISSVNQKNEVLKILSTYKDNVGFKLTDLDNSININRISHLVEASNTLIGNISESEINRIKRTISQCLGIESIYKEKPSERFWFGEESDMLEFKTSIVFPPARKGAVTPAPDPNLQIWQILKTINGFLNSLHGGTLLLGVNDYGNASGIEDDIVWLYNQNLIFANNVDRYIQYLKVRVDNAYEAYRRKDKCREITSTRIRYTSFQTDGYTVLRVDVLPYEMGCVKLFTNITLPNNQEIKRPEFIKEAYIRNTIATEELTDNLRHKIESDKRSVIKDSEKQALINVQEAIETNRLITLKNYQSASGVSDRILIPIDLLPLRGLVVGMEKGKKEAKIFKLIRCSSVEVTDETFKPSTKYTYRVDPFNMLTTASSKQFKVHLKLNRRAWLLLKEAHPYTENYLSEEKDMEYPYTLKCEISDVRGIGSFCMSVLGGFKIVDGSQLENYIKEQCSQYR